MQDSWRWLNLMESSIFNSGAYGAAAQHKFKDTHSLTDLHLYLQERGQAWPEIIAKEGPDELSRDGHEKQVARQSHRASGRTAQMANISVHETKVTQNPASPLSFSMEGRAADTARDRPFSWAPGWNSNQSVNMLAQRKSGYLPTLDFPGPNALLEKWPPVAAPTADGENSLVFVDNRQWFNNEWQSAVNPEFRLLFPGNQVTVATGYASKQNWQAGDYVAFELTMAGANTSQQGIARILCDDDLPEHLVAGNMLAPGIGGAEAVIRLSAAESQQVSLYQKEEQSRLEQAKGR